MKKRNILAPSILAADFLNLGEEIRRIEAGGAEYVHYDVMDGSFVPAISFGMPILSQLRKATDLTLDVHLMIVRPERYIEEFASLGADIITVHYEACEDPVKAIKMIHDNGKKAGMAIKPATSVDEVKALLPSLDMILAMTVEPGFGGQSVLPECLNKVSQLREYVEDKSIECDIEVDGGIRTDNIAEIISYGANVIVAGSAVFRGNAAENTKELMRIMGR